MVKKYLLRMSSTLLYIFSTDFYKRSGPWRWMHVYSTTLEAFFWSFFPFCHQQGKLQCMGKLPLRCNHRYHEHREKQEDTGWKYNPQAQLKQD